MYQALLTRRYLSSKIMPLLAAIAVMLCTAVVLLVWSIMGGFLVMLLDAGKAIVGDVAVSWPTAGFAHYEDLIDRLEEDENVAGATPVVETFGMLGLPDGRLQGVTVQGIDVQSYARVTEYERFLYWKPTDGPTPDDDGVGGDWRADEIGPWPELLADGLALGERDRVTGEFEPALVPGIEVAGFSRRDPESGFYRFGPVGMRTPEGDVRWESGFLPFLELTLNLVPVDRTGRPIEVVTRSYPVANEFRTEVFQIDSSTVFMPLAEAQRLLRLDAAELVRQEATDPFDEAFGQVEVLDESPARVTTVFVRGTGSMTPAELADRCHEIYMEFERERRGQVPPAGATRNEPGSGSIQITTWEQRQGMLIGAVQKEIALVLLILLVISFTASFLILAIFWAMVSEKTRDIGILRSIGATRAGVAWLWLRYGLAIGLIGSILGAALATLIVWNINPIHDWLGRTFAITVWDPKVYYFSRIPNDVEPVKAAIVVAGGLGFCLLGALIPAIRAAFLKPVEALRFE